MNLPPKPKTPVSLSVLAARATANKTRSVPPAGQERPQSVPSIQSELGTDANLDRQPHTVTSHKTKSAKSEASTLQVDLNRQRIRHRPETRAQLLERLTNPLISLHEASVLLRVCSATVRHYSDSGALPHVRTVGGQRRFYLRDVLALLRQQEARRQKK